MKGSSSSPKPGHITEVAKKNLADIGNKSEPQLDLGNGDPYELLKSVESQLHCQMKNEQQPMRMVWLPKTGTWQ